MTPADVVSALALLCVIVGAFRRPGREPRDVGSPVGRPFVRRRTEVDAGKLARVMRGGR